VSKVTQADESASPSAQAAAAPAAPARRDETAGTNAAAGDVMAAIHTLAEAFARKYAHDASDRLAAPLAARASAVTAMDWPEFLAGVEDPTCCYALSSAEAPGGSEPPAPLAPAGWIELSRNMAFACLQQLLGAPDRQAYTPNRALTAIERKIVRRVGALGADALRATWLGKADRLFQLTDGWACANEAGATAHQQDPQTVVASFDLALAGQTGRLRLCLSAGLLADLAEGQSARREVSSGPLELSVTAAEIDVPAEDLAALAPGDIVPTDTPADGEVVVRLAGIPKFAGQLGSSGGKRAVTLLRPITADRSPSKRPSSPGKQERG